MSVHIALSKSKKRVTELERELDLVQRQLWQLRGAVVGTWKEAVRCGSPWHKELRHPMVEMEYLQHDGWYYSVNPEWDALAMEWLRDKYHHWYGDRAEENWRTNWGEEE